MPFTRPVSLTGGLLLGLRLALSFLVLSFGVAAAEGLPSGPPVGSPAAPPRGLTADEVARRALTSNADLRAREAERLAAEAGARQAVAEYLPRLSGVARFTRLSPVDAPVLGNVVLAPNLAAGSVPAGTSTDAFVVTPFSFPVLRNQWLAQATLQIPLSDYLTRIPLAHAAATENARAAELTARAARRRIATAARLAFYQWGRARLQHEVALQAVAQAQAHLAEVTRFKEVGAASEADFLRVTSQLAAAELLLTRTQSLRDLGEQQVRTWIQDHGARPLEIGEDLAALPPEAAPAAAPDLQALWEEARSQRLERQALEASTGALHGRARVARAAGLPHLSAVGNLISSNPNPRVVPQQDKLSTSWDASLQLVWTPTDLLATTAACDESDARAQAFEAERDALDDALRVEVAEAALALTETRTAVSTATRGLAAAEESYRVRHLLFQNGRATNVEQSDAETDLTRARFEVVNATLDLRTAAVRLAHALGRDGGADRGADRSVAAATGGHGT